jgi:hypothetical protein
MAKAFLVFKDGGKVTGEVELEDRGNSTNFKKLGVGKFDKANGSDPVVVSVYLKPDAYDKLTKVGA